MMLLHQNVKRFRLQLVIISIINTFVIYLIHQVTKCYKMHEIHENLVFCLTLLRL